MPLETQKKCEVYNHTGTKLGEQTSGWSDQGNWNVLTPNVLTHAPANVTALLNKIRSEVKQKENWPVGVCAEIWCLLRALEHGVEPKNIRIKTAIGTGEETEKQRYIPCLNCQQWLEPDGNTGFYKLKQAFLPAIAPVNFTLNEGDFPPLK